MRHSLEHQVRPHGKYAQARRRRLWGEGKKMKGRKSAPGSVVGREKAGAAGHFSPDAVHSPSAPSFSLWLHVTPHLQEDTSSLNLARQSCQSCLVDPGVFLSLPQFHQNDPPLRAQGAPHHCICVGFLLSLTSTLCYELLEMVVISWASRWQHRAYARQMLRNSLSDE